MRLRSTGLLSTDVLSIEMLSEDEVSNGIAAYFPFSLKVASYVLLCNFAC